MSRKSTLGAISTKTLAIIAVVIIVIAGAAWYFLTPKPAVEEVIVIGTTDRITLLRVMKDTPL